MNPFRDFGLIAVVLLSSAAGSRASAAESITVSAAIEGDKIALSWNTVTGDSYAVKGDTDLALPWAGVATVPSPLVAAASVMGYALPMNSGPRFFRVVKLDPVAPAGMALIPAGSFEMGDTFSEGDSVERPVHPVTVSGFFMEKYEVTKALWDAVTDWASVGGYRFDNGGLGKAGEHPVRRLLYAHSSVFASFAFFAVPTALSRMKLPGVLRRWPESSRRAVGGRETGPRTPDVLRPRRYCR